jgi:cytochrome c peroxidase
MEQLTGVAADRYKFRTSPLRNAALQPAFFHNGAFTRLEDAIRHHLNVTNSNLGYNPIHAGLDKDLTYRLGPSAPVLARLDPLLATPKLLTDSEVQALTKFVRDGLLDERAKKLCDLIPETLPSGLKPLRFQGCSE